MDHLSEQVCLLSAILLTVHRSLYVTHDVTQYLQVGENAVGVLLGAGNTAE
jgi:hypothetical protein